MSCRRGNPCGLTCQPERRSSSGKYHNLLTLCSCTLAVHGSHVSLISKATADTRRQIMYTATAQPQVSPSNPPLHTGIMAEGMGLHDLQAAVEVGQRSDNSPSDIQAGSVHRVEGKQAEAGVGLALRACHRPSPAPPQTRCTEHPQLSLQRLVETWLACPAFLSIMEACPCIKSMPQACTSFTLAQSLRAHFLLDVMLPPVWQRQPCWCHSAAWWLCRDVQSPPSLTFQPRQSRGTQPPLVRQHPDVALRRQLSHLAGWAGQHGHRSQKTLDPASWLSCTCCAKTRLSILGSSSSSSSSSAQHQ